MLQNLCFIIVSLIGRACIAQHLSECAVAEGVYGCTRRIWLRSRSASTERCVLVMFIEQVHVPLHNADHPTIHTCSHPHHIRPPAILQSLCHTAARNHCSRPSISRCLILICDNVRGSLAPSTTVFQVPAPKPHRPRAMSPSALVLQPRLRRPLGPPRPPLRCVPTAPGAEISAGN